MMDMWTGACPGGNATGPDLKSVGLFPRNIFLNSLKTST